MGRNAWLPVPGDAMCVDGAQNLPFSDDGDKVSTSGQFAGDEKATVVIDCRSFMFEGRNERHVRNNNFCHNTLLRLLSKYANVRFCLCCIYRKSSSQFTS